MWPAPSAEAVTALVTAIAGLITAVSAIVRTRRNRRRIVELERPKCHN